MTVRALITEGVGPGSSIKFLLTGGLGPATAIQSVADAVWKRPGPAPGSYKKKYHPPERYYLPPGWKEEKRPTLEQVEELYAEARKEIPPKEQTGLLPIAFRREGRSAARLPPARIVNFAALRGDVARLREIFAALQDARAAREQLAQRVIAEQARAEAERARQAKIRRQEEEFILTLIFNHEVDAETVRRRRKEQEFVSAIIDNDLRSIDVQGKRIRFYARGSRRTGNPG